MTSQYLKVQSLSARPKLYTLSVSLKKKLSSLSVKSSRELKTRVQTISEHTIKVRSVFRNPEINRLNGQQINQQPIQCKIQNPVYCSRHTTYTRDKILKFEYNARALQMLQMKTK